MLATVNNDFPAKEKSVKPIPESKKKDAVLSAPPSPSDLRENAHLIRESRDHTFMDFQDCSFDQNAFAMKNALDELILQWSPDKTGLEVGLMAMAI